MVNHNHRYIVYFVVVALVMVMGLATYDHVTADDYNSTIGDWEDGEIQGDDDSA
jgi:hypothetical protein